jgi:hypothetical protein
MGRQNQSGQVESIVLVSLPLHAHPLKSVANIVDSDLRQSLQLLRRSDGRKYRWLGLHPKILPGPGNGSRHGPEGRSQRTFQACSIGHILSFSSTL